MSALPVNIPNIPFLYRTTSSPVNFHLCGELFTTATGLRIQFLPSPTKVNSQACASMCKGTRILWIQRTSTPSHPPFQDWPRIGPRLQRTILLLSTNEASISRLFALLRKPASTLNTTVSRSGNSLSNQFFGFPPFSSTPHRFVVSHHNSSKRLEQMMMMMMMMMRSTTPSSHTLSKCLPTAGQQVN
jgi:hypothetical protein